LLLTACLMAFLYGAVRVYAAYRQGYTWGEMDWNSDGSTSLSEFLKSSDIGWRRITRNGIQCTQYFAYKDGLEIKTACPGHQDGGW
jgi:hypothetical protein